MITDWAPSEGGTERYVGTARDGLCRHGDDVRLLTSSAGSQAGGQADFVAYGSSTRVGRMFTQLSNPAAVRAVHSAVREFRPDVVHVNMFVSFLSPGVVEASGDVPVVVTLHDYRGICPIGWNQLPDGSPCTHRPGAVCHTSGCITRARSLRERPRYALIDRALKRASRILTISSWMQETLDGSGLRGQVIPLPVSSPPTLGQSRADQPVFVYGGRLDREKGIENLLGAFEMLRHSHPEAQLRIYGEGTQRALVERVARRPESRVSLIRGMHPGWWDGARDAWAVVVPSIWNEPFGLVAAEAIIRGFPVIASDCGGLRETVSNGRTGLLHPRGDVAALARRMAEIASGDVFSDGMSPDDVEALAARHDPDRHFDRLRAVFRSLQAA